MGEALEGHRGIRSGRASQCRCGVEVWRAGLAAEPIGRVESVRLISARMNVKYKARPADSWARFARYSHGSCTPQITVRIEVAA
jgi:hypothetical protein